MRIADDILKNIFENVTTKDICTLNLNKKYNKKMTKILQKRVLNLVLGSPEDNLALLSESIFVKILNQVPKNNLILLLLNIRDGFEYLDIIDYGAENGFISEENIIDGILLADKKELCNLLWDIENTE